MSAFKWELSYKLKLFMSASGRLQAYYIYNEQVLNGKLITMNLNVAIFVGIRNF